MDQVSPPGLLRIGELSRRLGVSEHLLRAWERRYGLLQPARSPGGFRLYTDTDVQRVQRMQQLLAQGLSAAQAAETALAEQPARRTRPAPPEPSPTGELARARQDLAAALDAFDEPTAQAILDQLLSSLSVETVIRQAILPYLRELGDRWQEGAISTAQEHFASHLIRGRLAGLARGWGHGHRPLALLACPPGELHDIPLLAFGIVLHRHGWRIHYLGAATPIDDLTTTAAATQPDLIVLAATTPQPFEDNAKELTRLARTTRLAIAGAGATPTFAGTIGALHLTDDPVTAAEQLTPR
jgi:DNA-binding transcriptional MerR regulator